MATDNFSMQEQDLLGLYLEQSLSLIGMAYPRTKSVLSEDSRMIDCSSPCIAKRTNGLTCLSCKDLSSESTVASFLFAGSLKRRVTS